MSCFIVSPENIRAQAEFMACVLNDGYNNRYRMSAPESLQAVLEDCKDGFMYDAHKIYKQLYIMNLKAYNGRYHESVKTFERYKKAAPLMDLLQLHKYMKCYIYQCSEDPVYNTPLFNAVLETSRMLAELIVTRLDGYDNKEWN